MKVYIKKLLKYLFGKTNFRYVNLKKNEIKIKLFLSSDKSKEKYIQKNFKERVGYEIDFNNEPKTFNEKIQFRKLYDKNPLYSICADKYRVREYVKNKIGEEYLIPLLLVTDKLTEEQWDKLPNQFVAKANHNSGPVQIVKDKSKVNKKEIIMKLNYQLKIDYGILSLEKYYSKIHRKIIVEKFLEDDEKSIDLPDYKFYCFDGKPLYCQLIKDRNTKETIDFYDSDWNLMEFIGLNPIAIHSNKINKKPLNYKKMLEIASILSEDFDYARVDLYSINNRIYFGEITFCPNGGFGTFKPSHWNLKLGELWEQKKFK